MLIKPATFKLPKQFLHPEVDARMLHSTQVGRNPWKKRLFPGPVPVIKYYTGGKRGMIPQLQCLFPNEMAGLGSGFFGTGAVEFHLYGKGLLENKPIVAVEANPHVALIHEQSQTVSPAEIVRAYRREVRACEDALGKKRNLSKWRVTKQEYEYHKRRFNGWVQPELFEDPPDSLTRFHTNLFLLNTCIGGVFRFNQQGLFNVNFNKSRGENTEVFVPLEIKDVCSAMRNFVFIRGDYSRLCESALPEGSFIFLDPPYYDTYDYYTKTGFDADEFSRFVEAVKVLNSKGYQIMITQSFHPAVKEALEPIDGFDVAVTFRHNTFGSGIIPEYVFRNYQNGSSEEQIFMDQVKRVEETYVELLRIVQMGLDPDLIVQLAQLNVSPSDIPATFSLE